MFIKRFETGDGDLSVYGPWQYLGKDCLLSLWGGVAHIGAVGLAQSRPSLAGPESLSATASGYCDLGHKEDSVVKTASERLAAEEYLQCQSQLFSPLARRLLRRIPIEALAVGCPSPRTLFPAPFFLAI